ncbi:hypothetical protein J2S43_000977 [Catenuloplanes nepalensis]|uniref:Uncharacterized protein n=1 Tax=Catenuloplanes nepalensis TaxID=587533 RepID=A0ABT9MM12_9ACTN|nr:hypothetical protein [Catenuloplanes nepalensis]MDP9792465.1 hypothetical protein [Catenuloplanes nepalensis]
MTRLTRWAWPPGHPRLPLTVVGHGQITHAGLQPSRRLLALIDDAPPERWGVLFISDARGRKWTLYSPDADYTTMFAPAAHTLDITLSVFAEKFPGWNTGWRL